MSEKTFPKHFVWGAATSSYQIEGAACEDGKGPHIWDAYASIPGNIRDGSTGDVACDHYHRFREDVAVMQSLGLKAYRFSICWTRILPAGTGEVNEAGVRFYSELIDALLEADIEPWATLYHWEMPMALEMRYGGWLHKDIDKYFAEFARVCFERFGDRVKRWITINEGHAITHCGYRHGVHAPGRQVDPLKETYLSGHNLLRAHARAVDIYRREFQPEQQGVIGIANNAHWPEPKSDLPEHVAAAQRNLDFMLGWFTHPVYYGDYPESMREMLGSKLPRFTKKEKEMLQGSAEFLGLNHYHTIQASSPGPEFLRKDDYDGPGYLVEEAQVIEINNFGDPFSAGNRTLAPWGFRKLLEYVRDAYPGLPMVITENGTATGMLPKEESLRDQARIDYIRGYLGACHEAVQEGADVRGYFVWSLMDNFEWGGGYSVRFGILYTDYETQERIPKDSAKFYSDVIRRNGLPDPETI